MAKTRKKEVRVFLDPSVHQALLAQKDRTGKSLSALVGEAVERHLFYSDLRVEVRKAGEIMRDVNRLLELVGAELTGLGEAVRRFERNTNRELEELKKWNRVAAFWVALLVEFFKMRFTQARLGISDEDFETFKKAWRLSHERADARMESLTGERVWKGGFDPERDPLRTSK